MAPCNPASPVAVLSGSSLEMGAGRTQRGLKGFAPDMGQRWAQGIGLSLGLFISYTRVMKTFPGRFSRRIIYTSNQVGLIIGCAESQC